MSTYPVNLAAHLARAVTTACHGWRLTRRDGTILGFTDHDRALTFAGCLFQPESGFSASEARDTLGLAVDTVDIEGALSSDRIRDEDVSAGLYDGATVETFLVNWRSPGDFALIRTATIGKITRSDDRFVAELESLVHALDQPSGRTVSRGCDAEVGDARCGFALGQPGFTASGTVSAREMPSTLVVTGLGSFAQGWFTQGLLTWTSGDGAGRTARVEEHRRDATGVRLMLRPDGPLAGGVGDTFAVTAGCDKSFATCKTKFANALNFRGFPHLPGNDAAYGYVVDGGVFDGGALVP